MIKKLMIVECDICGHIEPASVKNVSIEADTPCAPENWHRGVNDSVYICPSCWQKLHPSNNYFPNVVTTPFVSCKDDISPNIFTTAEHIKNAKITASGSPI